METRRADVTMVTKRSHAISPIWREIMSSELVATYSSLGTREDNEYFKGEECLGEYMRLYLFTVLLYILFSLCERFNKSIERG